MKKILALTVLLASLSCQKAPTDFFEATGLTLGADFDALPSANSFTKVMDNEYNQKSYKVSDAIGTVADLNVTTIKGKISEVKFSTTEETNCDALKKSFKTIIEKSTKAKTSDDFSVFESYESTDKETMLIIYQEKVKLTKKNTPIYTYNYMNKEAMAEKEKLIKRMSH